MREKPKQDDQVCPYGRVLEMVSVVVSTIEMAALSIVHTLEIIMETLVMIRWLLL